MLYYTRAVIIQHLNEEKAKSNNMNIDIMFNSGIVYRGL
jgi:hypothetical protein